VLPTTEDGSTSVAPVDESHFGTLPVGAVLPSDDECAARVRPTAEIRPANAKFNSVRGSGPAQTGTFYGRVTGNFTGTTDEIIQWAACKWGIDEDIVRAQAAKESGWFQENRGDYTSDPAICVPGHGIGVDGRPGECPESIGMMQVRYQYLTPAFPMATDSSAYNLDEALAARRSCFEGNEPWLNTVDRGSDYAAGDLWGCIGIWFAGRWHTTAADEYAAAVRDYLDQQIWTTSGFLTWTPG
jgi:autotransporter family porin